MRNSCQTSSFQDLCPKKGEIMLLYSILEEIQALCPGEYWGNEEQLRGKRGNIPHFLFPTHTIAFVIVVLFGLTNDFRNVSNHFIQQLVPTFVCQLIIILF